MVRLRSVARRVARGPRRPRQLLSVAIVASVCVASVLLISVKLDDAEQGSPADGARSLSSLPITSPQPLRTRHER